MIAELPSERQECIEAKYRELKRDVECLRELLQIAGKAQADMYLSTLRSYVEAVGGEMELVVKLPGYPAVRLRGLGEVLGKHWRKPARAVPDQVEPFQSSQPAVPLGALCCAMGATYGSMQGGGDVGRRS